MKDPNLISNDGTPLHWLVKSNFVSIVDAQVLTNKNEPSELVLMIFFFKYYYFKYNIHTIHF